MCGEGHGTGPKPPGEVMTPGLGTHHNYGKLSYNDGN